MANHSNNTYVQRYFQDIPSFFSEELPIILGSAGCMFNTMLISYFLKTRKYRSPTFMMLTSLAFTDLLSSSASILYAVFLFPSMIVSESPYACKFVMLIGGLGIYGSDYHLVFFAAVRFYQLAFPLAARARITPEFVLKCCLVIWAVVLINMIALICYRTARPYLNNGVWVTVCTFIGDSRIKDLCFLIVATIIPCISISLLHVGKHIAVTCRQTSSLEGQPERRNTDGRVITIVIVLFFTAWFPAYAYMMIMQGKVDNYNNISDNLFAVLLSFVFYNSVLNPLVYCLFSKSIRDDIKKTFCPSYILTKSD